VSVTDTPDLAARGRAAQHVLATLGRDAKDAALEAIARQLTRQASIVLDANAADVQAAKEAAASMALVDRLTLDERRVGQLAETVRRVAALDDPCGQVVGGSRLPNGLDVTKLRVPLGRILVVYEARPNVTVDVAALCLKAGNVALLRGSSTARRTNAALAAVLHDGLDQAGLPRDAVLVVDASRDQLAALVGSAQTADVVVPRGGEALKEFLVQHARIPVLAAAGGNCHVYVDAAADAAMATRIVVNAKTQRPGVCNAAETLLIHEDAVAQLPGLLAALQACGVAVRGCDRTRAAAGGVPVAAADEGDWATEFLDLVMAVRVVDSIDDAIRHIRDYSTGHSEAIITDSVAAADRFVREVDSACVYVNASTRFTDGGEFGMGAEIGNSTSRLHVRGPIGLADITTTKYVIRGCGQIRD
jgi:glutamate-5-semialdehyde dehydrogenase